MIGSFRILNTHDCPVIKVGTRVEVLHIFEFPKSNKRFVTIRDDVNIPLNKHGQKEDIISTILLDDKTFQEDWIPIGYEMPIEFYR